MDGMNSKLPVSCVGSVEKTVSEAGIAWQKASDVWATVATERVKAEQAALDALAWKANESSTWHERVKACEKVVETTRRGAAAWAAELKAFEDMLDKTRDMVRAWTVDAAQGAARLAQMKTGSVRR